MYKVVPLQDDLREKIGSAAEDGSLDVHNRSSFDSNIRFYCVVADAEQEIQFI